MPVRLASLVTTVFAVLLGLVSAAAATTTTDTQHFTNMVESDVVSDCNGVGTYNETFTSSGVIHTTQLANGTFHFTVTAQGNDTLVPTNPALPTFSGHFAFWDGDNVNRQNDTSTFTQSEILFGSDGSKLNFQIVIHAATSAGGAVVSFVHTHCLQR